MDMCDTVSNRPPVSFIHVLPPSCDISAKSYVLARDVTEPANICICQMRISCAKSVGFGCGYGFVARSQLPAIMDTVIQLIYLKLSSCKRTSSEQLK